MKANVDRDGCIGCGLCASLCPDVFEIDSEGLASVIGNEVPTEETTRAMDARDSCPVSVISIDV